ncbi:uncharacterized protein FA14DRAFT_167079 [Meira miltonrushii]|uniref:HD/PDEase domain-containing protein n=1 Tax=Meira miltonrushii TaxID=1280837 RepID=A0A316VLC3_9BASI|nr:uncharacterized protein FA14DRAFT_167079 [Meira miltonrushii]PWN38317.1 hypothetical protein FA14DRAFT_167079 [Meira miltonrushii]
MSTDDPNNILSHAEQFVKEKFRNHDPSHDWHHVHRVRLMALNLTRCPSVSSKDPNLLVVELGALFHDLCDAKYITEEQKSKSQIKASDVLENFFQPYLDQGIIQAEQVHTIYRIVDNVSWSKEEARKRRLAASPDNEADLEQQKWEDECAEFQCISDADRLDSIGSIGIMRVAAFSAKKNRPLHIPPANAQNDSKPPAEQAEGYNGSAVAHFHEKLLKIRGDRLKTDMAREEAERRQSMMSSFLAELDIEWLVADQGAQLSLLQ